jgi:glycosyltransferase involved in cell wall biosynthesis
MPLEDSLWNRGKGGYKLLQYMAAGLPAVASPVGINADIMRTGENGFLARSEADWLNSLLALAQDGELRQRIGHAARTTIETSYSLDSYLERYGTLIEGGLK